MLRWVTDAWRAWPECPSTPRALAGPRSRVHAAGDFFKRIIVHHRRVGMFHWSFMTASGYLHDFLFRRNGSLFVIMFATECRRAAFKSVIWLQYPNRKVVINTWAKQLQLLDAYLFSCDFFLPSDNRKFQVLVILRRRISDWSHQGPIGCWFVLRGPCFLQCFDNIGWLPIKVHPLDCHPLHKNLCHLYTRGLEQVEEEKRCEILACSQATATKS